MIKDKFDERKESNKKYGDYLDHLLEEVKKEDTILSEEIAIDLVFVLLFATYETTSTAMTLAVKFISDHPEVQAELVVCELKLLFLFSSESLSSFNFPD